jgi:hypothetical protein
MTVPALLLLHVRSAAADAAPLDVSFQPMGLPMFTRLREAQQGLG